MIPNKRIRTILVVGLVILTTEVKRKPESHLLIALHLPTGPILVMMLLSAIMENILCMPLKTDLREVILLLFSQQTIPGKKSLLAQHSVCLAEIISRLFFKEMIHCILFSLGTDRLISKPQVRSYKQPKNSKGEWLAYQTADDKQELVVYNLLSGNEHRFFSVTDYTFDDQVKRC